MREWVEAHTEFLRDPDGAEMLHGPSWQIQTVLTQGRVYVDCDDVAMLAAALGKAIGLRARFVVVAFSSPNAPFRHVWTELSPRPTPQWVEVDVTRPAQGLPFNLITRSIALEV
ncbi:MAG: transglutaminase domain-containing protein [Pseudonocardiaceae bacterium]